MSIVKRRFEEHEARLVLVEEIVAVRVAPRRGSYKVLGSKLRFGKLNGRSLPIGLMRESTEREVLFITSLCRTKLFDCPDLRPRRALWPQS